MVALYLTVVLMLAGAYAATFYVSEAACSKVCELTRSLSWGLAGMVGVLSPLLYIMYLVESL